VWRGRERFNALSVQFDLIRYDVNPFITSYCTYALDAGRRVMIGGGGRGRVDCRAYVGEISSPLTSVLDRTINSSFRFMLPLAYSVPQNFHWKCVNNIEMYVNTEMVRIKRPKSF
jgi:hypothetical protein